MWTFNRIVESSNRGTTNVKKLLFINTQTSDEKCVLFEELAGNPATPEQIQQFVEVQSYSLNNIPYPEEQV